MLLFYSGESNGFYNKKHNKKTLYKIQKSRNETLKNNRFSWSEIILNETGEIYYDKQSVFELFNLTTEKDKQFKFNELIYNGIISYKSIYLQDIAIKRYIKRKEWYDTKDIKRKKNVNLLVNDLKVYLN